MIAQSHAKTITPPRPVVHEAIGWVAYLPLLLLPVSALLLMPSTAPRWALMWAIAFSLYVGFKWLTWQRATVADAPPWKHVAYLLAWPGMDANGFLRDPAPGEVVRPAKREWLHGIGQLLTGLVILFGCVRYLPSEYPYLVGWGGMVGMALVLHFGVFQLLSCIWRVFGIDPKLFMNAPVASRSVSEFWGKRWNTAFRDVTHRFLFRPLAARFGPRHAIFAGFLFSGVIHDLAISVPAGGGYGLPTLYFAWQGAAIFLECSRAGRRLGLGRGWRGWLFTMAALVAPAPLLFHPPFVVGIVVPFLHAMGVRS